MNKDSPLNIFGSSKPQNENKTGRTLSSLKPIAPLKLHPKPIPPTNRPIDPAISQMLNRIQAMRNDLAAKVAEIQRQTNLPPDRIWAYIKSSPHFNKEKWEAMEKMARELNQKMNNALGWGQSGQQLPAIKTAAKLGQERKARMVGARKNWIPMR